MSTSPKAETNEDSSIRIGWLLQLCSTKSKNSSHPKEERKLFQSDSIKWTFWHYQYFSSSISHQRNSDARNLEPDKFANVASIKSSRWKSGNLSACSSDLKRQTLTDNFLGKALLTNDCIYRKCISVRVWVKYWKLK